MTDTQTDGIVRPVPLIDHVVVNVRERMAEAAALYTRLGFALTPLGRHTLGSINHLAMFGPDYLELLGVPPGADMRRDAIAGPEGLSAVAFATNDADAAHAALAASAVPVLPALDFSRPVALAGGTQDAAFRVLRLAPEASPAGRLFFCQHRTRELVWRDEWRRHPNEVLGIAAVVIAAADPDGIAALFRRMFGADAVAATAGGFRLAAGLSRIDVLAPAEAERRYGAAAPGLAGREAAMVALVLRTADAARTAAALQDGAIAGMQAASGRVLVPHTAAMGVALEFRDG